jgi:hypothetical protein
MADVSDPNRYSILRGGTDETDIGNIGDRLKVTGDNAGASGTPGCPVFSFKLRHIFDDAGTALTTTYATVYTYTGSGKLIGFVLENDATGSIDVVTKLTIDGSDVVFELENKDVSDIQYPEGPGFSGMRSSAGGPMYNFSDKKLFYMPECPIAYETSVKIEAKTTSGTADMVRHFINLTKET